MTRDVFLVASVRASMHDGYVGGLAARPTSVTVTMAIEEVGSGLVVAESEPQDMLAVMDQRTMALVSCDATDLDYDGGESYLWRVTVEVVSGTVAGGIPVQADVTLWEPSFSFSEEASPQSFQPAIGTWIPNRLESIIDTADSGEPVITLYDPAAPTSPRFTMDGPDGAMRWYDTGGGLLSSMGTGGGATHLSPIYLSAQGFISPPRSRPT